MATQLQIRRGTSTQVAAFTGAEGEIVVNTTNDSVHVNDGSTAGGFELARADLNNVSDTSLNAALTGNTVSALTVTSLTSSGINVTGTVTADGLTVDGATTLTHSGTTLSVDRTGGATTLIELQQASTVRGYLGADSTKSLIVFNGSAAEKFSVSNAGIDVTGTVTATNGVFSGFVDFKTGGVVRGNIYSDSSTMIINTQGTNTTLNTNGGNVGIGVSDPSTALDVNGVINVRTNGFQFGRITTNNTSASDGGLTFQTVSGGSFGERMRIDSSGRVGIGITNLGAKLDVLTGSDQRLLFTTVGSDPFIGAVNAANSAYKALQLNGSDIKLLTNGAERMRIDSSGDLLWHQTPSSSASGIAFTNTTHPSIVVSGGADTAFRHRVVFVNGNGTVGIISTNGSATTYATSSDYRLKENVVPLTGATERLKQLNPSRFNFIADADVTVDGFLAHEVQDIVPEAITGTKDAVDDDGNAVYQGIDQSKLVPLLVATIQELEARITQLENN
jgi:hypothetical protein